mgnify:CR=1 FL=1
MPLPTWPELLVIIDHIGVCGVTLLVLMWHMVREERSRRLWERRYNHLGGEEEK